MVVGAGVFGAWCAWRLSDEGHAVTLIDAFGPANGRASSADHSRVIRAGYGPDAIYSRWASESRHDWEWLSAVTGRTLVTTTGALFMGKAANTYLRATHETLTQLGVSIEWLDPAAIANRFPQISIEGLGPAVFEPEAGVIRARDAVQALVKFGVSSNRLQYRIAAIEPLDELRTRPSIKTSIGPPLEADLFVLACGPWLPRLCAIAVGGRIRPTRQEVLYFGIPAGSSHFSAPEMPVSIDFEAGVYGVPDFDAHGFKVGIDRHGPPIDPTSHDRVVHPELIETTLYWLARRFPGLAGAPLVDAHVCQYENTSSGDFVIDRHPAWENVWIVGGGSGHGFKHGPAIARYLVDLIANRVEPDPRFSLASKSDAHRRQVY